MRKLLHSRGKSWSSVANGAQKALDRARIEHRPIRVNRQHQNIKASGGRKENPSDARWDALKYTPPPPKKKKNPHSKKYVDINCNNWRQISPILTENPLSLAGIAQIWGKMPIPGNSGKPVANAAIAETAQAQNHRKAELETA